MSSQRMSRRNLLKMAGAFTAGAVLASCAPQVTQEAVQPAEGNKEEPQPSGSSQPVRVELWTGFGQGRMADAMAGAIKKFNEGQSKFTVEHIVVPWGDIRNKVVAATAAKTPPDVYRGWSFLVGEDAPIGGLSELTNYIMAKSDYKPEDYWPATVEQMKYDGKYYGLSVSTMINLWFFNRDRMKEAGIDPNALPEDLEGWEEIGKKLYEVNDGKVEKVGFCPLLPSSNLNSWAATRNITLWDPNTKKCIANDAQNKPKMVELFNWYKSYAEAYGAEELQAFITAYSGNDFGRNTPEGVYYTGRLAMWTMQSWIYNDMKEYGPNVDLGYARIPMKRGENGKPGALTANLYLVPAGSKAPEGGFEFGYFMMSDPWVAENKAAPDAVTPSKKSNAELPALKQALPWLDMAVNDILPNSQPDPSMPAWNTYQTKLNDALNRVVWENADPGQALDDAVTEAQNEVNNKLGM